MSLITASSLFKVGLLGLLVAGCSDSGHASSGTGGSAGQAAAGAHSGGSQSSSGSSGSAGRSGASSTGGSDAVGGDGAGGDGAGGDGAGGDGVGGAGETAEHFSFFYTSLAGMRRLSKSQNGFGGDLRYGEADGLAGADKICRTLAAEQGAAFGKKTWRAYLSAKQGANGKPVNAVDRIGSGPWYDRLGRLIAKDKVALYPETPDIPGGIVRPDGDPAAVDDFADEAGIAASTLGDVHDAVTGSDPRGLLNLEIPGTCDDWTSATRDDELLAVGHAFSTGPIPGSWSYAHVEFSCVPSVNTSYDANAPVEPGIGSGGGYGGFYCFALEP